MFTKKAKRRVALKDGFFPKPQRAALRFVASSKLADLFEQVERQVTRLHTGEQIELKRLPEDPGREALLDQDCARAILRLVNLRRRFPLQAKERANDG